MWISYVGSAFIHRKGLDLDKYLVNLLSPKVPLDELGLLIVARMYHWHITVITNLYTWTTGWDLVASDCRVVFAYTGGVNFQLVCDRVQDVPPLDPLSMVQPKKRSNSLSMDGPPKKHTKSTKKTRHTKSTTQTRTRCRHSKHIVKVPLPYRSVTMQPRGTNNSCKIAASAFKVSLDNILTNNRKHKAAPKASQEQDPIAPHLSSPSDVENKSDHESEYEQNEQVVVDTIKTAAGALAIAQHGLVKCERKVKKIVCPVCSDIIYTQKHMNVHMREKHPKFNFQCSLCEALFQVIQCCSQTHTTPFSLTLQV